MVLSKEQEMRFSRQLVLPELGADGQQKLLRSKVLVIGAGGLGSPAILYLAAAGVGTIGIADHDSVDLSNLQRQILHRSKDVGTAKTRSAEAAVRERDPDTAVRLHEGKMTAANIREAVRQYDFILDCTDRFPTKFLINDACVLEGKPYSHAGVVRFGGQAMTYVPGQGPCLRCLLGGVPPKEEVPSCAQTGVLGAAAGVIGSIQALEAVKYLIGAGRLLTGRILQFDGLAMRFHTTAPVPPNPDCRICGSRASRSLSDFRAEYEEEEKGELSCRTTMH